MNELLTTIFGGIFGIIIIVGVLVFIFYDAAKTRKHMEDYHKHIENCCDALNNYFSKKED